mgnify:CR=1 FL=1
MIRICLTGSEGFIGSNLSTFLKKKNFFLYKINRKKFNKNYLVKVIKKSDVLIHCVGSGEIKIDKNQHNKNNFKSTKKILSAIKCSKNFNLHLIFLSTQAVYAKSNSLIDESTSINPINHYGKTKFQSEQIIKNFDFVKKKTILRLFSIYGGGIKKQIFWDAFNKLKKNIFTFYGNGNQIRDFLNVKDFNILMNKIIKHKNNYYFEIFNVGSGEKTRIKHLINLILKKINRSEQIKFIKDKKFDNFNYVANISKVSKYFKWTPKIKILDGTKRYATWFKKNYS